MCLSVLVSCESLDPKDRVFLYLNAGCLAQYLAEGGTRPPPHLGEAATEPLTAYDNEVAAKSYHAISRACRATFQGSAALWSLDMNHQTEHKLLNSFAAEKKHCTPTVAFTKAAQVTLVKQSPRQVST